MIEALGRFGLSEREADLYLTLLRRGRGTARELTRERKIDRVLGYRLLDGLRERGVLLVTAERPRRFVPVRPQLLIERALEHRRVALSADEELARGLPDRLAGTVREDESVPRYQVLAGSAMLYPTLVEMVARAKVQVSTMITRRALRESMRFGLHRRIGSFLKTGGRFRLLVESEPLLDGLLRQFGRAVRDNPLAEIRQISPQPTRMTVVDGREVLLYIVPEVRGHIEEVAIWTDTPEFARGHQLYFDGAWKRAKSITSVVDSAVAPPRGAKRTRRGARDDRSTGSGPRSKNPR
jgi:sugar-specific transcriptional regulator TrmB